MSRETRVGSLLGRPVHDASGVLLGRVADVETARVANGRERVVAVVVTAGHWGRLLGYERAEAGGPWLLEWFARLVLRREMHRVPWDQAGLGG
jgi:hypothetical protein